MSSRRKGNGVEITDQITSIDILISDPGKTGCSHLSGEITELLCLAFSI
jgi:hypothetical protein